MKEKSEYFEIDGIRYWEHVSPMTVYDSQTDAELQVVNYGVRLMKTNYWGTEEAIMTEGGSTKGLFTVKGIDAWEVEQNTQWPHHSE